MKLLERKNLTIILIALFSHYVLLIVASRLDKNLSLLKLHLTHSFWDRLIQWDSQWYVEIGLHGYNLPLDVQKSFMMFGNTYPFPSVKTSAFFPLMPFTVHIFGIVGALIVGNILFVISVFLLAHWLSKHNFLASCGVLLYALNPTGVYESALYVESLLTISSMFSVILSESNCKHWWGALLGGYISSLSTGLGIVTGVLSLNFFARREWIKGILYGGAVLLGWVTYGIILMSYNMNPFSFLMAERIGWGRHWAFPLLPLFQTWVRFGSIVIVKIEVIVVLVYVALLVAFITRWIQEFRNESHLNYLDANNEITNVPMGTAVWTVIYTLFTLSTDLQYLPLRSQMRYISVVWPLYGLGKNAKKSANIFQFLLVIAFVLLYFLGCFVFTHGLLFE